MRTFKMTLLVVLQLFMLSSGCRKDKNKQKGAECPANVMCTQQFVMVNITIINAADAPVVLDSVYTTRKSTGEIIHNHHQWYEPNVYTVLDDSYQQKLKGSSDTFIFTGIRNGQVVVNEEFVIAADCCHISYVRGSQTVVVP